MKDDLFIEEELEDFDLLDSESDLYDPDEDDLLDSYDEDFYDEDFYDEDFYGDPDDLDVEDDDSAEARYRRRYRSRGKRGRRIGRYGTGRYGRYGRGRGNRRGGRRRSPNRYRTQRPRYAPQPSRRSNPPKPASNSKVRKGFERAEKAIKNVDLDSKVQGDILTQALKKQGGRISRSEYSQAASKIIDQAKESYPELESNPFIKAALPLAPLLLLKPNKKGKGLESILVDPRFWGPAIAAALAIAGGRKDKSAKEIELTFTNIDLTVGDTIDIIPKVVDSDKKPLDPQPELQYSSNKPFVTVNGAGEITAVSKGNATVTVKVKDKDVSNHITVRVKDAPEG